MGLDAGAAALQKPRTPYPVPRTGGPGMTPSPTNPTQVKIPNDAINPPPVARENPTMAPPAAPTMPTAPKPMAPAPASPLAVPSGGQPFSDLRSTTLAPTPSTGTTGAQSAVNAQTNKLTSYNMPAYAPSADTNQVRALALSQLQGAGAPDRAGLASSIFGRLVQDSEPQYAQDLRQVAQKNAAVGRAGSGMVNSQLSDVTSQREHDLASARGTLADEAAGLSLSDRLAQLQATSGLFGQFGSEDRANSGASLDQFNSQRGLLGDLGNLEGQRFNEDVSNRNELRGERDYQGQQSQQAIQNALQQKLSEEQLFGNDFDRHLRATQVNGALGYGDTPASTELQASQQNGQQAASGNQNLTDLMQNWSYLDWLKKQQGQGTGANI